MPDRHLLYHWNQHRAQMELEPHGLRLPDRSRVLLETEFRRRYQFLIEHLGRAREDLIVQLDAFPRSAELPSTFQVGYADAPDCRNPALIFVPVAQERKTQFLLPGPEEDAGQVEELERGEPVAGGSSGGRSLALRRRAHRRTVPRHWIDDLLYDLDDCFTAVGPHGPPKVDRAALNFAMEEFRTLCREPADQLPVIILAGYVALCKDESKTADAEEAALYRLAARGLERLFGLEDDPDAGRQPAARAEATGKRTGSLRRISRILARILGLDDIDG